MRRILGMIGAAAAAIVMLMPSAGPVSAASFGHASIGGYEHFWLRVLMTDRRTIAGSRRRSSRTSR